MLIELAALIIIIEVSRFFLSLRKSLIKVDDGMVNFVVNKYGRPLGITYVALIAPLIEELGFRIVPWFITHNAPFIIALSMTWWVSHIANFKYIKVGARIVALYMLGVGLGGVSYTLALFINPFLPLVMHVVNNTYSLLLVWSYGPSGSGMGKGL